MVQGVLFPKVLEEFLFVADRSVKRVHLLIPVDPTDLATGVTHRPLLFAQELDLFCGQDVYVFSC
jgi:hypothetical protein